MNRIAELNKALNVKLTPTAKVLVVLAIVVLTVLVVLVVIATLFALFLALLDSGFAVFIGITVLMMSLGMVFSRS